MLDPSKVTFSEKTLAQLQNPVIKPKRKRELRRQIIMEEIRRRPAGTKIATRELAEAAGFTGSNKQNMMTFVRRMERDKLITIETIPKTDKKIYTVVADSRTVVPKAAKSTPQPVVTTSDRKTLTDYAQEFSWKKNSDSLRGFIEYMDGVELDLRRQIQGGGF